jgi:hypothetical protein
MSAHQAVISTRAVVAAALIAGLSLCGCREEERDAGGSCSRGYDQSIMDQCVQACIKCENGVTTTCTTSCTLKGARKQK